jgi:isopenicillin N synthase-like dioxygenase
MQPSNPSEAVDAVVVPVIDLSCFAVEDSNSDNNSSGTTNQQQQEEQARVAHELYEACSKIGFFYIRGHGCPPDIQSKAFEAVNELFDSEEKLAMNATKSPLYRGYNSVQTGAHSCTPEDRDALPDLKESFTIGAEDVPDKVSSPMHGPNQWPTTLPNFGPAMRAYWDMLLSTVAVRLMRALALSLKLDDSFFLNRCDHPVAQMILLRYPGTPTARERRGCGTHTDCGFLTVLAQDNVEGLEVQRADGTWMSAPPLENTFVVNLGDMAARWTNDVYQSTPHRVYSSQQTRHSIPFFLNCNFDTRVECLVDGDEVAKYPPTEAGRYILEKLGLMHMIPTDGGES